MNINCTNFDFKKVPKIINSTTPIALGAIETGRIKFVCTSNAIDRSIHFETKVKLKSECWESYGFGVLKINYDLEEEEAIKSYIIDKLEKWCSNGQYIVIESFFTKSFDLKTKVVDFLDLFEGIYKEKII